MRGLASKRLDRYQTLKRLAEEQNQIKEAIHKKITSRDKGDRILTRKEYQTMGLAWSARQNKRPWSRLLLRH